MAVEQTGDVSHSKPNELQPLNSRNSLSEPDLATAGKKIFTKSGFPPGMTVDDLSLHRRKRPSADSWPHDNLTLREGSFKSLKTEYCRRFKNYYDFGSCGELGITPKDLTPIRATKHEDTFKVDGTLEFQPEYYGSFIEYPLERSGKIKPFVDSLQVIDSGETEMKEIPSEVERLLTECSANYVRYPPIDRLPLVRKSTNLKLEGDIHATTEYAEKFIEYLLTKRCELARRPTTLKLEAGDMDVTTENMDKYIAYEYQARPPLCKKFTNLHLEGDLELLTEKQEKFLPYTVQRRPKLTKKLTNLHIEGDLDLLPEYRKEFVEFKAERTRPVFPVNNLKTDGFYDVVAVKSYDLQIHPKIPFLRSENDGHFADFPMVRAPKVSARKREENLLAAGREIMETKTESSIQYVEKPVEKLDKRKAANNLHLEGRIDMNPEYRNAYIDYSKDGRVSPAKFRNNKHVQPTHLKTEGKMDISPEYTRSYVNFPRERPKNQKPQCSLSSEGEMEHVTEKSEKYVAFPNVPKTAPLRKSTELKLEGEFECQPEYRKAYIDYLTRERLDRKSRPLDNLGKEPERAVEIESLLKTSSANLPKIHEPTSMSSVVSANGETSSGPEGPTIIERKMELLQPVVLTIRPPSSTASSAPSTPKFDQKRRKSLKSARNQSLTQIEAAVFGPKLTVPKKTPSRSSSPLPHPRIKSRTLPIRNRNVSPILSNHQHNSATDSESSERPTQRRFANPVRVENLALKPLTPIHPMYERNSTRNNWIKNKDTTSMSHSVESNNSTAFVVLSDKEMNNNLYYGKEDQNCNGVTDEWIPSWYDPNSS